MPKIIEFSRDFPFSPDGVTVLAFAAGDIIEVDDDIAEQCIEAGAALAVDAAALAAAEQAVAKFRAAADKARKKAIEARRTADCLELDAKAAENRALEVRISRMAIADAPADDQQAQD
jgi:hypothetical protein